MESIYYVLCWHCHRRCRHCYEDRFRPYIRDELEGVVKEAQDNAPQIIANLPDSMQYREEDESTHTGRIILSGGDVLTDPVREPVLYLALEAIRDKYRDGVHTIVQTTGDLLTPKIIDELLARDVHSISISGMDDYHTGLEGEKKNTLRDKVTAMLEAAGVQPAESQPEGPTYTVFGATEDSWIGKLWPRGRAWQNGLSRATIADNFCNAWSGGLNFLKYGMAGSEVSIDPAGDVYPCCIKTAAPLGNLLQERLEDILRDVAELPAMQAINAGQPQQMGLSHGWDEARYRAACNTTTPDGEPYANLCIGCDQFHREVLGPILQSRRNTRLNILASTNQ